MRIADDHRQAKYKLDDGIMRTPILSRASLADAVTGSTYSAHPKSSIKVQEQPWRQSHLFQQQPAQPSQGRNSVIKQRPSQRRVVETLLIDNYDSYTFNLFQLLAEVNGAAPTVIKNDELSWQELAQRLSSFDSVVISPGPGTPLRASDIGVCNLLLEEADNVPILGVCLGMQALAHTHGGRVVRAPEPIHGRLSEIEHSGHPLFAGLPSGLGGGLEVVRYHSLAVDEASLPECLESIAWTTGRHHAVTVREQQPEASSSDGDGPDEWQEHGRVLMGLAHRSRPHWGVQFHPESVATTHGAALLRNFRDASALHRRGSPTTELPDLRKLNGGHKRSTASEPQQQPEPNLDGRWQVLRGCLEQSGGSEAIFWGLFGQDDAADTFWLDSASQEGQRFSYMGGRGGPLWRRIIFKLAPAAPDSAFTDLPDAEPLSSGGAPTTGLAPGLVTTRDARGREQVERSHFLDFLERQLQAWRCRQSSAELPFDFTGGFVGYLGYELKAECGAPGRHVSPHPDAAMFLTDRVIAIDHAAGDVYLVAMHEASDAASIVAADAWLASTSCAVEAIHQSSASREGSTPQGSTPQAFAEAEMRSAQLAKDEVFKSLSGNGVVLEEALALDGLLEARRSRAGYMADISECLEALRAGESYELCLTTVLRRNGSVCARRLYSQLRASNPSAHAAWLSFGSGLPTICCSSPERFLRGTYGGVVEARPIKGTAARSEDPALDAAAKAALVSSAKARAENLMIVDLLRNDLSRFCQVGSVHVSGLMDVESYATVHNLVSTVRGVRQQASSIVDCLRAAFPGGSMTGAPKLRSMQILDRLENGPRGVYSGALGFIGLNDTFDLNIVIRTAVVSDDQVTIGAGGAIVLQSDPEAEYDEMRLKARALIKAINICAAAEEV